MNIPDLNTGQVWFALLVVIIICFSLVQLAEAVARPFVRDSRDEGDGLVDQIEKVSKDSTVDLLNALSVIEETLDRIAKDVAELADPLRKV